MDYLQNANGIQTNKLVKKSILKNIFISPLFYIVCLILVYFSDRNDMDFFYIALCFTVLFALSFNIFFPIFLAKKHNRIVSRIYSEEEKLHFETLGILCLKPKIISLSIDKISVSKTEFDWIISKKDTNKMGCIIRYNYGEEIYLIKEFFEKYNLIVENISPQASASL
ncbi:hypothetical protein [Saccharicrinis aurantiacus]|uniref:hypothetical protein n=1 Tax=Saccharicrinis aurantiacus TaxID=1849719 RepID=UPI002491141E|nr:hypothetical protein [Saccharicrinis aurantiacus]